MFGRILVVVGAALVAKAAVTGTAAAVGRHRARRRFNTALAAARAALKARHADALLAAVDDFAAAATAAADMGVVTPEMLMAATMFEAEITRMAKEEAAV